MRLKTAGLFIVVAVVAIITLAALHRGPAPEGKTHAINAAQRPDRIRTARPQRKDFAETAHWFGTVESRDRARLIALENGRIVSIIAEDGMPVTAGQLLLTIGGPSIDSRQKVLKSRSAALQQRMTLAERMVTIKRDAVSQQFAKYEELTVAEDALFRLKAELESAGQEIHRLQAAIHVRATVDGVFTNRQVAAGQEVQKGDALAEIIAPNHLYIAATLFPKGGERELEKKRVVIDVPGEDAIQGTISTVFPQRTAAGASAVWIEGSDVAQVLRPGQTVSGRVVFSVHDSVLAIPKNAIVRNEKEQPFVFLKDSSGYRRKPVKTGISADGWIEITSGLMEEDEVVVQGAYELFFRDFNKIYKVAD